MCPESVVSEVLLRHILAVSHTHDLLVSIETLRLTLSPQTALQLAACQQRARVGEVLKLEGWQASVVVLVLEALQPTALRPTTYLAAGALSQIMFPDIHQQTSFLQLVAQTSFHQAMLARQICAKILQDGLAVTNCLYIMALAIRLGLTQLREQAAVVAARDIHAAISNDTASFTSLPEDEMMGLLHRPACLDAYRRRRFDHLALWVACDEDARRPAFARLLDQLVHALDPDLMDLLHIDAHALVGRDAGALRVIARHYLRCLGCQGSRTADSGPTTTPTAPGSINTGASWAAVPPAAELSSSAVPRLPPCWQRRSVSEEMQRTPQPAVGAAAHAVACQANSPAHGHEGIRRPCARRTLHFV